MSICWNIVFKIYKFYPLKYKISFLKKKNPVQLGKKRQGPCSYASMPGEKKKISFHYFFFNHLRWREKLNHFLDRGNWAMTVLLDRINLFKCISCLPFTPWVTACLPQHCASVTSWKYRSSSGTQVSKIVNAAASALDEGPCRHRGSPVNTLQGSFQVSSWADGFWSQ